MIFVASLGMMKDIVIIKRRTKQVKPATSAFKAPYHKYKISAKRAKIFSILKGA